MVLRDGALVARWWRVDFALVVCNGVMTLCVVSVICAVCVHGVLLILLPQVLLTVELEGTNIILPSTFVPFAEGLFTLRVSCLPSAEMPTVQPIAPWPVAKVITPYPLTHPKMGSKYFMGY
jgi:hypothetical protein